MELDSRIKEGKRPLNCFDTEQAKQFIGKKCYFSDDARDFMNLDKADGDTLFYVAELQNIWTAEEYCFADNSNDYRFILPLEWVKPEESEEPEKKYRVLTLNEFLERFKIGDAIYIRFKRDKAERVVVFTEYSTPPHKDEGNDTESVCLTGIEHHNSVVCLGMREYDLTTLFDRYEYFDGKEWQPFGVMEDD